MQRFFSYRSQEVTQARIDAGHDDLFDPDYETKQHDTAMEFIQRYYHEYYPFDQDITMQTEMNVYEELTPDIGFSGKIDRLGISGDTFTLYDYKTSKSYDPDANDTVKKQLVLYSALIARRYGHKCKRIIAKAIYLRLQNEITREVTPEMIGEILQEYQTTAQTIIDTQKAYTQENLTPDEKESLFPTQSGTHCTYCAYQIHCPLFKHQFMDDQTVTIDTMTTTSIKHMIDKYRSLKLQIK
jgi:RecB family exonuclease